MRKYDRHSLSPSALLAEGYRQVREPWSPPFTTSLLTTESGFLQKDCFPARSPLLVFWNPPAPTSLFGCRDCSLSGWTPRAAPPPARPRLGSSGPPRSGPGRAAAAAGRGHAHVRSTFPGRGRGRRRGGAAPARAEQHAGGQAGFLRSSTQRASSRAPPSNYFWFLQSSPCSSLTFKGAKPWGVSWVVSPFKLP